MAVKTVDEYISSLEGWKADVVAQVREIVLEAAPDAKESIKWAQPVYEKNGPFSYIKAFKNSVNFGFWRGVDINDKKNLLQGTGEKMRHFKLTSPEDINKFIYHASVNPQIDIFIGNRMYNCENMPRLRRLTNTVMSSWVSNICRQHIPDSQGGFRLIKREALKALELKSSNYEIETEIIIDAARKGFKIKSIPIQTIYRQEVSQINPVVDTLRFVRYLLRIYWTTKQK